MQIVILTALGIGASTLVGSLIGFIFKKISHGFNDMILSFAAGVMLSAAVLELILPSLEYGGQYSFAVTVLGIFAGAFCLSLLDRLVPHMHKLMGLESESSAEGVEQNRAFLFILAIAIHNFPEGIAAGVGFGGENTINALLVAGGIALQNVPEGMVIIAPMLAAGVSPQRTLLCALITSLIEVAGTLTGYLFVRISTTILPFALAFAGGTMLYVVCDEMIPETHVHDARHNVTYALLAGFCLMLISDVLLA